VLKHSRHIFAGQNRGGAPYIPNFGSGWRLVVSFVLRPLYPQRKSRVIQHVTLGLKPT